MFCFSVLLRLNTVGGELLDDIASPQIEGGNALTLLADLCQCILVQYLLGHRGDLTVHLSDVESLNLSERTNKLTTSYFSKIPNYTRI